MVRIGNDWDEILSGEFDKEYYLSLREFLKAEYSKRRIYPPMKIHFVVGKKDSDIAYWMESLENGLFSGYVIAILKAELKKRIAIVPVPTEKGRISRKIDTSIYVSDENVLEMLSQIPQGKRSRFIRSVIRKHLSVNYKTGVILYEYEKENELISCVMLCYVYHSIIAAKCKCRGKRNLWH